MTRLRDRFFEIFGSAAIDEAFADIFPVEPDEDQDMVYATGLLTTDEQLRINHLRMKHYHPSEEGVAGPTRHSTVVYKPRQDLAHTLEIATAVCSELDCFTKKQGARIALTRFINGQTTRLPPRVESFTDNLLTDQQLIDRVFG